MERFMLALHVWLLLGRQLGMRFYEESKSRKGMQKSRKATGFGAFRCMIR